MSKRHFLLVAALAALSSLALVACGGSSGGGDESKIEEAIETSATTNAASNCTELETQNFVEQSSEETGKAAVKGCEEEEESEEGEEGKAESVDVSEVEIDGSKATANAALNGGPIDGQTVEVSLVEEDGNWKLDELTGFAKLDIGSLAKVFSEQLEKSGELTSEQTSCIVEGFEESSKSEIEGFILGGDSTPIQELAESCA